MFFFRLISYLPFFILYRLSDFLFFLICYVFQYRKKVVLKNLKNSFPNKSDNEINKIIKGFYLNLTDVIVETLKTLTISKKELKERVEVQGMDTLNNYLSKGQSVVVMTSHLCNWEWMLVRSGIDIVTEIDAVYQKLNNPFFDGLMKVIRGRFNSYPITMKTLPRELVNRKGTARAIALVADQTPAPENAYWSEFLNQETSFYFGPAKIALGMGYPVVYTEMLRVKRGHYVVNFKEISTVPYINTIPEEIISRFIKLTEESISKQPSNWLWSHNRWKHKKGDYFKNL